MKIQGAYDDLMAQFLAKGGKVERCETGADSGFTSRDWSQAVRGECTLVGGDAQEERKAERAALELMDTMAEAKSNGHRITGYNSKGEVYTNKGIY
ncbi:hypothetical protein HGG70_05245 [Rhodobacteraceae bacterium R_SAG4]|nr:hypothetical protein [Rhodobacteraceae bacterium R_SAG4]